MRIRQPIFILLLVVALCIPAATHGLDREDELRADVKAAFEIVSKAEQGGVKVEDLVEELNEALAFMKDGQEVNFDLAETKIDAIIASASVLEGQISTIAMFRGLRIAFIVGLLVASVFVAKRYGQKAFWTLWLRIMRDWTVHT